MRVKRSAPVPTAPVRKVRKRVGLLSATSARRTPVGRRTAAPRPPKPNRLEIHRQMVRAMYANDLCERCCESSEDRRHMLVSCRCNRTVILQLHRALLRRVQSLAPEVSSVPNWFSDIESADCNSRDSRYHVEIGRYDKCAGMCGYFPVRMLQWLSSVGLSLTERALMARQLNLSVLQTAVYIYKRRNLTFDSVAAFRVPAWKRAREQDSRWRPRWKL
jgi:hypothetical protein